MHPLVIIGDKPYVCQVPGCEAAYSQSHNLTLHVKAAHQPRTLNYPCSVPGCAKAYASKNSLLAHSRAKHTEPQALPCPSCASTHKNIDQVRRCVSTVAVNFSGSMAC
jgi:hypothetical protein